MRGSNALNGRILRVDLCGCIPYSELMTKTKTINVDVFAYDFVEYEKNDIYATILIHYGVLTYVRSVSMSAIGEEGMAFVVQEIVGVPDSTQIALEEVEGVDNFDCRVWVGTSTFEE